MGLPQVRRQCCAGGQSSTANAWRSNLLSGYAQQAAKVLGTQGPRRSGARLRLLLGYTLPRSLSVDSFMQLTDLLSLCLISQVTAHAAYAHRSGKVIARSCYLPYEQGCANQHDQRMSSKRKAFTTA